MRAAEPEPIDLMHLGRDRVICAWLCGDVIVDPGPASCAQTLLAALGARRPRALALTHIHLDHAGAAGVLVQRWPGLEVWVHERGAPHLIDPSRLLDSAARLYGAEMQRLWGEVAPVPEQNIVALAGGEQLGSLRVAYAPGHASHHVVYLHANGDAFAGDAAGVRIGPSQHVLAPTPPPDIDLDAWASSIEALQAERPRRLLLTHFGAFADPATHLDRLRAELARAAELARDLEKAEWLREAEARLLAGADAQTAASYRAAAPPEQSWLGLRRYWDKRPQPR